MNRSLKRRLGWASAALFAAIVLHPGPARAVIINTNTGTGNTTAPADDPGFANVGTRGIGSAVYLGNRWAITASHVWTGPTTFNGIAYDGVPGSEITLSNNGQGPTDSADLVLYQLSADPGLPTLSIASATPANGSAVTMIGAGRDRGSFTTWNVNSGVWTVGGGDAAGYLWGTTRTMRWGTNSISGENWLYFSENGTSARVVETTFDALPPDSTEAQAAAGDSGGALFFKNGGAWELAGIMLSVGSYVGQPGGTAVFGNLTYSADLPFYRSQIVTVVPEPSAVVLAVAGVAAVFACRRRKMAAACRRDRSRE